MYHSIICYMYHSIICTIISLFAPFVLDGCCCFGKNKMSLSGSRISTSSSRTTEFTEFHHHQKDDEEENDIMGRSSSPSSSLRRPVLLRPELGERVARDNGGGGGGGWEHWPQPSTLDHSNSNLLPPDGNSSRQERATHIPSLALPRSYCCADKLQQQSLHRFNSITNIIHLDDSATSNDTWQCAKSSSSSQSCRDQIASTKRLLEEKRSFSPVKSRLSPKRKTLSNARGSPPYSLWRRRTSLKKQECIEHLYTSRTESSSIQDENELMDSSNIETSSLSSLNSNPRLQIPSSSDHLPAISTLDTSPSSSYTKVFLPQCQRRPSLPNSENKHATPETQNTNSFEEIMDDLKDFLKFLHISFIGGDFSEYASALTRETHYLFMKSFKYLNIILGLSVILMIYYFKKESCSMALICFTTLFEPMIHLCCTWLTISKVKTLSQKKRLTISRCLASTLIAFIVHTYYQVTLLYMVTLTKIIVFCFFFNESLGTTIFNCCIMTFFTTVALICTSTPWFTIFEITTMLIFVSTMNIFISNIQALERDSSLREKLEHLQEKILSQEKTKFIGNLSHEARYVL